MRTSRFTEQQVVAALRQAENGTPVGEVCRGIGILRCDTRSHAMSEKGAVLSPGMCPFAGSRSLHASPATAGCEARDTAQGERASAPTPGQGKAGRVNASESPMRFRYPSRSQLT